MKNLIFVGTKTKHRQKKGFHIVFCANIENTFFNICDLCIMYKSKNRFPFFAKKKNRSHY